MFSYNSFYSSSCGSSFNPLNINIIHQNIRSLRPNFYPLLNCLDSNLNYNPDIIFLTEIWIYQNQAHRFEISGYTHHTLCNASKKSGGVAVYIRDDIYDDCEVSLHDLFSSEMIMVTLNTNNTKITIMCFYRLHEKSKCSFLQDLNECLIFQDQNVVILGDMNIDISVNSAVARRYRNLMSQYGFLSYVNRPTRITQRKRTCLDHIFARLDEDDIYSVRSWVRNYRVTDHCMTGISLQI